MSANGWRREMRIMDFCRNHANQIIAELRTSGGDHYEDIRLLDGLIETWEHLGLIAEEAAMNEEHHARVRAEGGVSR